MKHTPAVHHIEFTERPHVTTVERGALLHPPLRVVGEVATAQLHCAQPTSCGSKSNECTFAPSRRAARLKSPEPLPISRKVLPSRLVTHSISRSDASASAIRRSSSTDRKRVQLCAELEALAFGDFLSQRPSSLHRTRTRGRYSRSTAP